MSNQIQSHLRLRISLLPSSPSWIVTLISLHSILPKNPPVPSKPYQILTLYLISTPPFLHNHINYSYTSPPYISNSNPNPPSTKPYPVTLLIKAINPMLHYSSPPRCPSAIYTSDRLASMPGKQVKYRARSYYNVSLCSSRIGGWLARVAHGVEIS